MAVVVSSEAAGMWGLLGVIEDIHITLFLITITYVSSALRTCGGHRLSGRKSMGAGVNHRGREGHAILRM